MSSDSWNKPICVDLFCGAGGLSDGLRQAGFSPVMGIDFDPNSLATYEFNHKGSSVLCKDIRDVKAAEIESECDGRELDLLAGGPACQGYSTHGKRIEDDPRNFLFKQFIRLAKEVRPKAILIENVKGLLTFRKGYFRNLICDELNSIGYNVAARVLCAADYGVPQLRHRIFFVATRSDHEITFPRPTHSETFTEEGLKPYVTVGEAISDLPTIG